MEPIFWKERRKYVGTMDGKMTTVSRDWYYTVDEFLKAREEAVKTCCHRNAKWADQRMDYYAHVMVRESWYWKFYKRHISWRIFILRHL